MSPTAPSTSTSATSRPAKNKLSFRARALDPSRPMTIMYAGEDRSDLPETGITRGVPQMPTGMDKDEECEHHLQKAIHEGNPIPTPGVLDISDPEEYDRCYPCNYTQPEQLIRAEQLGGDVTPPDYDMDSDDEQWCSANDVEGLAFEGMVDRLEAQSVNKVVPLEEAQKLFIKSPNDVVTNVYNYWLNKRLVLQRPLLIRTKTEPVSGNHPYVAFRRHSGRMQTRRNRKNDEGSYEKMLDLQHDTRQVQTLLDLVSRRETMKKEKLKMNLKIFEARYSAGDFDGKLIREVTPPSPARAPLKGKSLGPLQHGNDADWVLGGKFPAQKFHPGKPSWVNLKDTPPTVPKRFLSTGGKTRFHALPEQYDQESDDESADEDPFAFRPRENCTYLAPKDVPEVPDIPVSQAPSKVGIIRRRIGRGGRVIFDRGYGERTEEVKYEPEDTPESPHQFPPALTIRDENDEEVMSLKLVGPQPSSVQPTPSGKSSSTFNVYLPTQKFFASAGSGQGKAPPGQGLPAGQMLIRRNYGSRQSIPMPSGIKFSEVMTTRKGTFVKISAKQLDEIKQKSLSPGQRVTGVRGVRGPGGHLEGPLS